MKKYILKQNIEFSGKTIIAGSIASITGVSHDDAMVCFDGVEERLFSVGEIRELFEESTTESENTIISTISREEQLKLENEQLRANRSRALKKISRWQSAGLFKRLKFAILGDF